MVVGNLKATVSDTGDKTSTSSDVPTNEIISVAKSTTNVAAPELPILTDKSSFGISIQVNEPPAGPADKT